VTDPEQNVGPRQGQTVEFKHGIRKSRKTMTGIVQTVFESGKLSVRTETGWVIVLDPEEVKLEVIGGSSAHAQSG
jgi:hypothetical protein